MLIVVVRIGTLTLTLYCGCDDTSELFYLYLLPPLRIWCCGFDGNVSFLRRGSILFLDSCLLFIVYWFLFLIDWSDTVYDDDMIFAMQAIIKRPPNNRLTVVKWVNHPTYLLFAKPHSQTHTVAVVLLWTVIWFCFLCSKLTYSFHHGQRKSGSPGAF